MYDMSGFDYGIRDVAQILALTVRHNGTVSMDVDCPFCGKRGKLNINAVKDVYHCNYCDEKGGMLQLYATLHNVSFSEANQQIREALNRGQFKDEYRKVQAPITVTNSEMATSEIIHQTYSELLSQLVLNKKHEEDLIRRGLTKGQIETKLYRSVPLFGLKELVNRLIEKGCCVQGVPGFYKDKNEKWTINFSAKNSGILIPIVSVMGEIQGFQIRVDHVTEKRKYIWLSSVNYQQGVSSGSPIHIIGDLSAKQIYVTEGALKGTIAHYLSGYTFVCVSGVNQHRNLQPLLEVLKNMHDKHTFEVLEAYDMDKKLQVLCDGKYSKCKDCKRQFMSEDCPYKVEKRKCIQKGCIKLYDICREISLPIHSVFWDTDGQGDWNGKIKGIDDYYYEMKKSLKTK